jgi:hypothetical protein
MKKQFRQLTDVEKQLCKKNMDNRLENIKWLKYQIRYYDLMLEEGLYLNYLKTVKEFKQLKKGFEDELKTEEEIVKELQNQIKNGVEVKKPDESNKSNSTSTETKPAYI